MPYDYGDGYDYPPMKKRRSGLVVVASVGGVILLCLAGFIGIRSLKSAGKLGPNALTDSLSGDRSAVREYIAKNASDSDGLEIVEWGEPEQVLLHTGDHKDDWLSGGKREAYQPATLQLVKWREKTPFGGKMLYEAEFMIQGGKVGRAAHDEGHPFLKSGGKVKAKIVRGTITQGGRAVNFDGDREAMRVMFESLDGASTYRAEVVPPRYEVTGLPPGNYRVTFEWDVGGGRNRERKSPDRYREGDSPLRCKADDQSPIQVYNIDLKN